MEGIPRGEAESPKAMPWQGCGCVLCTDVHLDRDGIPSARVGSIIAKRKSRARVARNRSANRKPRPLIKHGRGKTAAPVFSLIDSVDRLAQEIVAALGHRFVGGHEVLAIGGGVARVRDELHGLAEIGLVVIKGGWGDAFTIRSKVLRLTLSDTKDSI